MVRMGESGKEVEMEEVSRGEEFVQAGVRFHFNVMEMGLMKEPGD